MVGIIYVSNLPSLITPKEVRTLFEKSGKITRLYLKSRNESETANKSSSVKKLAKKKKKF